MRPERGEGGDEREGEEQDAGLLAAWVRGDAAAFANLWERWAPRLLRYIAASLGERRAGWAEDCLQETFLRLRRNADRYDRRYRFSSWVFSMARTQVMDTHRRETLRRHAGLDEVGETLAAPPGGRAPDGEDEPLRRALAALPEEVRGAILLVHLEGMTRAQAARSLGIPPRRVQSLCHEGFTRLRRFLGRPGEAAGGGGAGRRTEGGKP